ncbi:glycoside hydrolase family 13 protein, partial [Candidatus Bipolaricaulota bacterium]|nr:glycoside hydrolase family 13 protein [Candidatus Bipolaricaulota bacterium]
DRKGLQFDQDELRFFNLVPGGKLVVTFAATETDVEEVVFRYGEEGMTLERFATLDGKDFFRGKVTPPEGEFEYNFLIKDGEESVWYNPGGEVSGSEKDPGSFRPREKQVFRTPDWVRDATFYQIFPDRFYNAVEDNDPEKIELYREPGERYDAFIPDWDQGVPEGSPPVLRDPSELTDHSNEVKPEGGYYVFYGGDLQGIEEKIPYLKELGVDAIYFNPLFESNSNHQYSTADYRYIDGNLAYKDDPEKSNEYAFKLIEKLHDHGIRVIFDAVFNHSGYEHWAFQDVVEKGEKSEYKDWFFIDGFPIIPLAEQSEDIEPNYGAWWGYGSLPELDTENPEVRQHLFEITEKWMDPEVGEGVDGWRLDVPNEIANRDPEFWREWREHVKSIDEDAYIVGEIWDDASSYLDGEQFDAVMNYRFRDAVIEFVGKGEATGDEFAEELTRLKLDYPAQSFNSLLNLLDSHDTKRYLTTAGGNKERLKLAALLQFTLPGAPMVYYGDEIGMEGGEDPDCRRTMVWNDRGYTKPDQNLRDYYEKLVDLRDERVALRRGNFVQRDLVPEMAYGFERRTEGERFLIMVNGGEEEAEVSVSVEAQDGTYPDLMGDRVVEILNGDLTLRLDPLQGAMIDLS